MPTDHRAELQNIRTFPSLVKYLRDEMNWPISTGDFEELTFEYTPEELGIDAKNAAKIEEIKRLRPLSTRQPWGIFFVKFEPRRLPVVALRRILAQLAVKKRSSANNAERRAWEADDLLFVSNYGEGTERQISFAHFSKSEDKDDLPTLKVLGWDSLDTPLHLDAVADRLTHDLAWPDDESDIDSWRDAWRSAFTLRHREVITTSRDLSIRLAQLARSIRDRIDAAVAIETDAGPLTTLMRAFQEALVHDLDADTFADMYAQTIAYGLLSARVANPTGTTADDLPAQMPVTNPFLKELMVTFLRVGGRQGKAGGPGIDFDELGVNDVVSLLDAANMESVVRDFGDRNPDEDPVIHFYELFLREYDPKKRMQRGVFYTPRPVVSYIVRSVDEILRTEFGLDDGLADTTTWATMRERRAGLDVPDGVDPSEAFVQILDPATGTGTFLVEAIDLIYRRMSDKWLGEGHDPKKIAALWNDYVPKSLLPRLHGYELLMAPYAIAHLKIGLKLLETGYAFGTDERVRVYMTNSLEPARDFDGQFAFAIPALAHEAMAVNAIKRHASFTVVIGNPPYSKSSANRSDEAEALVANYKALVYGETNVQPLSDDYIKFLAYSFRASVPHSSVVGLITNRSYLDGLIHRGLRKSLLADCLEIYVVDLHGDSNVGESPPGGQMNENVFDITQGVAISVFVRLEQGAADCVHQEDVWGTRQEKYAALETGSTGSIGQRLAAAEPYFFFAPKELDSQIEQSSWLPVNTLFRVGGMGIKSRRDAFLIDQNRDVLRSRFEALASAPDVETLRSVLGVADNVQWSLRAMQELVRRVGVDEGIAPITYRPFDNRFIWYHREAIERGDARWPVMKHIAPDGLCLLAARQSASSDFTSAFVVRGLSEMKTAESTRGSYVYPLLLADSSTLVTEGSATVNLALSRFGAEIAHKSPEEVLHFVYAILHSPAYRSRYSGALRIEFPRIPPECSESLAEELCRLGGEIVALHLLESAELDRPIGAYVGPEDPEVGRVAWSNGTVWLDAGSRRRDVSSQGTIGFHGVPETAWKFEIGGYQVCHKWLYDRRGRGLSAGDIEHYQRVVVALTETVRLMHEIDAVILQHGGWPAAFQ